MSLAIAGATGKLGQFIAAGCLAPPFRESFRKVIIFTRDPSKPLLDEFRQAGATIVQLNYSDPSSEIEKALESVEVLIDCQSGGPEAHKNQDVLLDAAIKSASVKYYIPSQFGVDVRQLDFMIDEWAIKIKRDQRARAAGKFKVISIYPALFLEDSFGPWLGFDVENRKFEVPGSSQPFSLTSKADIGLAVGQLASTLVQGAGATIPDHVRIGGTTTTPAEAAQIFSAAAPSFKPIELTTVPLAEFKAEAIKKAFPFCLLDSLRVLIGEGKLDHSKDNHDFAYPKKLWQFTSIEEYAKSVNGRPFCSDGPQDKRSPFDQVKQKLNALKKT